MKGFGKTWVKKTLSQRENHDFHLYIVADFGPEDPLRIPYGSNRSPKTVSQFDATSARSDNKSNVYPCVQFHPF